MLNRDNRIRRWRKHGNFVSSHLIVKERDYVAVMSVESPGGVLWHVVCPKLCSALPKASHLTFLWPGIINRHFALLSQESHCRPSAFSEVLTERLFVVHWVEKCPPGDAMYSHPSSLSVFPVVSCFNRKGFSHRPSVPYRDSVSVLSVSGALWSDAEAMHKCILFCLELSQVAR